MVAKQICKGRIHAKCSKELSKKSNAKGHYQENQKHGTKGKSKGKGKANMEDNEIKASQKKDPKGWSDIQQGEPFNQVGQRGCDGQAQEAGQG